MDAMTRLDAHVLAALRSHPHDDTLDALLESLRGPEVDAEAVAASLERMRREGLLITAGGHWQLTAAGWRTQRAA